ncbi:hypothetical protein CNR27_08805 [Luteimonas chenhongjianii]|uniref:Integral membrane bound transporter domain-containing protein n=2 Tax=Luteimonas chenhongjianii TaxID=2006110 RepID=A0A290XEF1_9GAMM|nr:hypothetical protein CNR27_08805 [Luteimonas chenhongjianii]
MTATLRLYLMSLDPGGVGFRMGLRVMLTLAMVCLVLWALDHWIPLHAPSYVLGMITAIQSAIQVRDRTRADRALTRFYAALGGFAAIAGIAAAGASLLRIDALLLVTVFLATCARRLGPRWQAVGMFAFMCAVVGSFLKAPEAQLPQIALVLGVSGLVAHLVQSYLMPTRPPRAFRRVVTATTDISRQLRHMLGTLQADQRDLHWKEALGLARRLRSDIRMCLDYLPMQLEGPGAEATRAVTLRLLDLQLALESALYCASSQASRRPDAHAAVARQLQTMQEAETGLATAVATLPATFPDGAGPAGGAAAGATPWPERGQWLEDPQLRIAIQATLACAIAMVGGRLISSDRWFWAVLAAFLVFMNTQNTGAVTVRALNRAMGTLAGIVVGIGLATLLGGDLYLTVLLVALSVFGVVYLARISYAGMNICINVAIALAYGLVGIFTPRLLVLRLEETVIGAAAGIFCALAVLPIGTHRAVEQAKNRLRAALQELLEALAGVASDDAARSSVPSAARAVDLAFAAVLNAYEPFRSVWHFGTSQASTDEGLRRSYLLAHAAHLLEHALRYRAPTPAEAQQLRAVAARLQAVQDPGGTGDAEASAAAAERRFAERQAAAAIPDEAVRHALQILSESLEEDGAKGRVGPLGDRGSV